MGDRVDMRTYGGLAKVMPYTYVTFLLGYLAIIGFPGLSGFFTKDKIIEAAFDKGGTSGWIYGIAALLGAGLTAFYMTRLMCMTFWGKRRWEPTDHPHDPPTNMVGPMVLLAIGSVLSGFLFVLGASLQHWLQPVVGKSVEEGAHTINPGVLTALTLVVVAGGAGSAWLYFGRRSIPRLAPVAVSPFTFAARRALLADALNETVIATPGTWLMRAATWADSRGIDNAVNGIAAGIGGFSGRLRRVQTGFVRSYALSIVGGTGLTLLLLLVIRAG
jgi:NADH-quinone oxidoreductase subunit L